MPTGKPRNLHIHSSSEEMVTFRWKKVDRYFTNGKITGYHYRLSYEDDGITVEEGFLPGEYSTEVTLNISNLSCRHCYVFSVNAANSGGIGPGASIKAGSPSQESRFKFLF